MGGQEIDTFSTKRFLTVCHRGRVTLECKGWEELGLDSETALLLLQTMKSELDGHIAYLKGRGKIDEHLGKKDG